MAEDVYAISVPAKNAVASVLIITADKCHDLEFFYPYYRLSEAGYHVDVATPKGGQLQGKFGMKLQETLAIDALDIKKYSLLYIPGGQAPEELRKDEKALSFVKNFAATGKPIAAICHGAQVLVSAGLAKGKRLAAWPEVESEVREAGGIFVNAPIVEDGQYITSRQPGDLPVHLATVIKALELKSTPKIPV